MHESDRSAMDRHLPSRRLRHDELTRAVIGAFYDVYNALGFGFLEQVYVKALAVALQRAGLGVEREQQYDVYFRDVVVGRYRVDLLVHQSVLVEVKATHALVDADRRQVLNSLRCTGIEVALLLHFGPVARFERIVLRRTASTRRDVADPDAQ